MQTFTTRDGMKVAYYIDDFTDPWITPDTMLLLHAAMGNAQRWFKWVPRLAPHFRVVRMELRGHGASQMPAPSQPFSLAHLVGDALELLDHLEVESAHVVGNSAGGYVAQRLAIEHPERVKTLALYGAPPGLKNSHAASWIPKVKAVGLKKFLADTIDERFDSNADPQLVKWFIGQAGANDPDFIARFVTHMTTHWFMDEVSRIKCPTLMVAAGKEKIGQSSAYDDMRRRIGGSRLLLYDTGAHNICDGYAERCVDDLLAFLQKV